MSQEDFLVKIYHSFPYVFQKRLKFKTRRALPCSFYELFEEVYQPQACSVLPYMQDNDLTHIENSSTRLMGQELEDVITFWGH